MSDAIPELRFFEDYRPGAVYTLRGVEVAEHDIIEVASRFDPQPMHVDRESASSGPYGSVIACGWHTIGLIIRVMVDQYVSRVASLPSPGIDEIRWHRPVRPGDRLTVKVLIADAVRSRRRPDRGLVRAAVEAHNQDGELVATFKAMNLFLARPEGTETIATSGTASR